MSVHATANTTPGKYPCVHCGSESTNIIREGGDPRLKCNRCNGMFNGSESLAAKQAEAIPDPDNPPVPKDPTGVDPAANPRVATPNPRDPVEPPERVVALLEKVATKEASQRIPRAPEYVFISKTRDQVEYVTQKDLKKTVLKWESGEKNYNLYALAEQKPQVKVEFDG